MSACPRWGRSGGREPVPTAVSDSGVTRAGLCCGPQATWALGVGGTRSAESHSDVRGPPVAAGGTAAPPPGTGHH